eukprot:IDg22256t1
MGRSLGCIVDWYNLCREVCSKRMENEPRLIGTPGHPVQIDESYFSGRRKYNRGRLLSGNQVDVIVEDGNSDEDVLDWNDVAPENEEDEAQEDSSIDCKDWKWVFGLYSSNSKA